MQECHPPPSLIQFGAAVLVHDAGTGTGGRVPSGSAVADAGVFTGENASSNTAPTEVERILNLVIPPK